jgi:MoxR-like ATPase
VLVPFPGEEVLKSIIALTIRQPGTVEAVAHGEDLLRMVDVARAVPVASSVADYAVRLLLATHPERADAPTEMRRFARAGASPRGLQALITGSQVRALLEGRFNASVDDVRALALPVLRHRILLNFEGQAEGLTTDTLISNLVNQI